MNLLRLTRKEKKILKEFMKKEKIYEKEENDSLEDNLNTQFLLREDGKETPNFTRRFYDSQRKKKVEEMKLPKTPKQTVELEKKSPLITDDGYFVNKTERRNLTKNDIKLRNIKEMSLENRYKRRIKNISVKGIKNTFKHTSVDERTKSQGAQKMPNLVKKSRKNFRKDEDLNFLKRTYKETMRSIEQYRMNSAMIGLNKKRKIPMFEAENLSGNINNINFSEKIRLQNWYLFNEKSQAGNLKRIYFGENVKKLNTKFPSKIQRFRSEEVKKSRRFRKSGRLNRTFEDEKPQKSTDIYDNGSWKSSKAAQEEKVKNMLLMYKGRQKRLRMIRIQSQKGPRIV